MAVRYAGSPYHKRHPSRWGAPVARSGKTLCPAEIAEDDVVSVFERDIPRQIERGCHSHSKDGDWPRYVWGRSTFPVRSSEGGASQEREVVWEARVLNRGVPEYKAYPIQRDRHSAEMPPDVEEDLWP